jgi:cyclophilin family peptidyl-prolyl cis-trans isomerase
MTFFRTRIGPVTLALLIAACGTGEGGEAAETEQLQTTAESLHPVVVLETSLGDIALELDRENAPESVNNLLRLVQGHVYDNLQFHRVVEGSIVQVGVLTADMKRRNPNTLPVANEADNGLKNVRGTVAMARSSEPNSATSQFFINLRDNPGFDHQDKTARGWGYAVFGTVVEGMELADSIGRIPTRAYGQHAELPIEPVVINRAYIR